jgi:hypothetical protein
MDAGGDVSKASREHFVLVHGACHGAWCWFKLACLLQRSGHRVSCIDLAGAAGSLADPNTVRSFDEYDAPLVEFMAALPDDGHKVTTICRVKHAVLVILILITSRFNDMHGYIYI